MQIGKLKKFFTMFFVIFILASCAKDTIVMEPPAPAPKPPSPNENKISYSGFIQPIFTEKCISCHGNGGAAPTLVDGKSYSSLMNTSGMIDTVTPGNSILYKEMIAGDGTTMFDKGYCKKKDADSVYKWIRQGAKNN